MPAVGFWVRGHKRVHHLSFVRAANFRQFVFCQILISIENFYSMETQLWTKRDRRVRRARARRVAAARLLRPAV